MTSPARSGVRLNEHDLAVVDSPEDLLAVAVPYLEEGLVTGDLTQVYVLPDVAALLTRAVPGLDVVSAEGFRAMRKPDAIIMRRRLLDAAEGCTSGRLRVLFTVAEPTARAWQERGRSEAVHNAVYADTATSTLCVYDRTTTPPEALLAACRTHPHLRTAAGRVPNGEYREPRAHLASLPHPEEPLQATEPLLAVDAAVSLGQLRHRLAAALRGVAGNRDAEEDFHLACSEIASNAFRHGRLPVSARLWAAPDRLVCTITDCGTSPVDPLVGFEPAHGQDLSKGGMGVWLARKLCDHVDLLQTPQGLTVRLSTAIRRPV